MKLITKHLGMTFVLMLTMNPINWAMADHRGGNGGDGEELEMTKKATQIAKFLETTAGKFILNDPTKVNNFKQKVKEVDFQLVTGNVIEKYNSVRTCVNILNGNVVKCNYKRWNETSEENQYILIFHEVLNLIGLDFGAKGDVSAYPISSKLRPYYLTIKKISLSDTDYRAEYYAKLRDSYGYEFRNGQGESLRMICLQDGVEPHRCDNFNVVIKKGSLQGPLVREIYSINRHQIKTMMNRMEQFDFYNSILDREIGSEPNEYGEYPGESAIYEIEGAGGVEYSDADFMEDLEFLFNPSEKYDYIGDYLTINFMSYDSLKKRLKNLLVTSQIPESVHFDLVKETEGTFQFFYPMISLNGEFYMIGTSDEIKKEFCARAGFKQDVSYQSDEFWEEEDEEADYYLEIESLEAKNPLGIYEYDGFDLLTSSISCSN